MDADARHEFAIALRQALAARGLPLARVQARLEAAGHHVAMSTISQWQRGHRLPRSPRSLAIVDELELVLELPAGSLRRRLPGPGTGAEPADDPVMSYAAAFDELVEQLGGPAYGTLTPVGIHDRLWLDEGGALSRRRTTSTWRAQTPTDRQVVAHGVDEGGDVDMVDARARRGCRTGRVVRDPEAGVVAAELHFDRRLSPGETVVHEVQFDDRNPGPSSHYYRGTALEIPLLVIELTVDRSRVPTRIEGFRRERSDGPDLDVVELPLVSGEQVHLVRQPAQPGVHGIRWAWARH